jgi:hypothetical protein
MKEENPMEKMTVKESAETRATLYSIAISALEATGLKTEPFKGGVLIDLGNGYFAKMAISICDATKFNLEETRAEYAAQVEARNAAAEKAAAKAAEKAKKAAEKAKKDAEKAEKAAKTAE